MRFACDRRHSRASNYETRKFFCFSGPQICSKFLFNKTNKQTFLLLFPPPPLGADSASNLLRFPAVGSHREGSPETPRTGSRRSGHNAVTRQAGATFSRPFPSPAPQDPLVSSPRRQLSSQLEASCAVHLSDLPEYQTASFAH